MDIIGIKYGCASMLTTKVLNLFSFKYMDSLFLRKSTHTVVCKNRRIYNSRIMPCDHETTDWHSFHPIKYKTYHRVTFL